MKVLTFIIPAYNSEKFLKKCIPTMLLPGVLEKLEIIVVNDGSTDATTAAAQKYCDAYPETVRLISQENKGHGGALNTGCAAACGKYLKVIDADDWVATENLPAFVQFLENCGSDVVLTHHHTIDVGTGEVKGWKSYPKEFGKAYAMEQIVADWKSFERSLTFHGITYRTEFYREYGIVLSEHVFYEDYEYATYPCCHAESVTVCDLFIYEYRIGDVNQSVSNTNQLKRVGHTQTVLKHMICEYDQLPEGAGRKYAALKIVSLLLSYFTTTLLVNPNKREGRELARRQMERCRTDAPEVYTLVKRKYDVFVAMNRLHISKQTWDRILNSGLYSWLRKKQSFE